MDSEIQNDVNLLNSLIAETAVITLLDPLTSGGLGLEHKGNQYVSMHSLMYHSSVLSI